MKKRDTDNFFDATMVLLANGIRPVANEFFKLMEWLLVISALSFASEVNDHLAFKFLKYSSIGIMYFYILIGYLATLDEKIDSWVGNKILMTSLCLISFSFIIVIAALVHWFALQFADQLANAMNSC